MFLVNSRLGLVSATLNAFNEKSNTYQVPLIPKLRGYFAEFLHHDSLDRLGILYLSTCVGLGYGRLTTRSRRFSRQHRITEFDHTVYASCFRNTPDGFTYLTPYTLTPGQPSPGTATFLRPSAACLLQVRVTDSTPHKPEGLTECLACLASLASTGTSLRRYGNINPLSIDYACRPRLRSRLTQGRLA